MYLIEQASCRKYFNAYDPAQIGLNGLMDEEMCKIAPVQTQVAQINGLYAVLGFIPRKSSPCFGMLESMLNWQCSYFPYWSVWQDGEGTWEEEDYAVEH